MICSVVFLWFMMLMSVCFSCNLVYVFSKALQPRQSSRRWRPEYLSREGLQIRLQYLRLNSFLELGRSGGCCYPSRAWISTVPVKSVNLGPNSRCTPLSLGEFMVEDCWWVCSCSESKISNHLHVHLQMDWDGCLPVLTLRCRQRWMGTLVLPWSLLLCRRGLPQNGHLKATYENQICCTAIESSIDIKYLGFQKIGTTPHHYPWNLKVFTFFVDRAASAWSRSPGPRSWTMSSVWWWMVW